MFVSNYDDSSCYLWIKDTSKTNKCRIVTVGRVVTDVFRRVLTEGDIRICRRFSIFIEAFTLFLSNICNISGSNIITRMRFEFQIETHHRKNLQISENEITPGKQWHEIKHIVRNPVDKFKNSLDWRPRDLKMSSPPLTRCTPIFTLTQLNTPSFLTELGLPVRAKVPYWIFTLIICRIPLTLMVSICSLFLNYCSLVW